MSDVPSDLTAEGARDALERFLNWRNAKVQAELKWLQADAIDASNARSFKSQYDAKILRRDQVLFCVARIANEEFKYSDIEAMVREKFPETSQGKALNVTTALSELAEGTAGILQRNSKRDAYMLKDPIFRTLIEKKLRFREGGQSIPWA